MQEALTPKPTHRQGRRQHEHKSNIQQQCDSYWGRIYQRDGRGGPHQSHKTPCESKIHTPSPQGKLDPLR